MDFVSNKRHACGVRRQSSGPSLFFACAWFAAARFFGRGFGEELFGLVVRDCFWFGVFRDLGVFGAVGYVGAVAAVEDLDAVAEISDGFLGFGFQLGGVEFAGGLEADFARIFVFDRNVEFADLDVGAKSADVGFDILSVLRLADDTRQLESFECLLERDGFDFGAFWHWRELWFSGFVLSGAELQHRTEAAEARQDWFAGLWVGADFA